VNFAILRRNRSFSHNKGVNPAPFAEQAMNGVLGGRSDSQVLDYGNRSSVFAIKLLR
jgi:hypothetical protein